jgi:cation transport regulator ChaB
MATKEDDLPATLERSPGKAQRTYAKALASAEKEYGDEARAHKVAFAALKHSFKKQGDRWVAKAEKGPSDPQSAKSGKAARKGDTPTGGGKDVGTTKTELLKKAKKLKIKGRSKMDKSQLTKAVAKAMR